jgi:hypothetical protein
MRRHSHRHRSASRHPTLLQRVASATFLVIGIGLLVWLCWLTPTGRFMLACAAVVPAFFALVRLSYFAGRGAAKVRNSFALQAGQTSLEKIMRARHDAQHAR